MIYIFKNLIIMIERLFHGSVFVLHSLYFLESILSDSHRAQCCLDYLQDPIFWQTSTTMLATSKLRKSGFEIPMNLNNVYSR
jgi:hypothetical protein